MRNILKRTIVLMLCSAMVVLSLSGYGAKSSGGAVSGNGVKILMTIHDDTDTFLNTLTEAM